MNNSRKHKIKDIESNYINDYKSGKLVIQTNAKSTTFGRGFNKKVDKLPSKILIITFGQCLNQPV